MKKIFALMLSFAILLTAAISFTDSGIVSALADEDDELEYSSFYYISDNASCQTYFDNFMKQILLDYGISTGNMHVVDFSSNQDTSFGLFYENDDYCNIKNAFVVLEFSQGLGKKRYEAVCLANGGTYFDMLNVIVPTMYENWWMADCFSLHKTS